jgi:hypothetical protein
MERHNLYSRSLPRYETISYCWGMDRRLNYSVLVSGKELFITKNAYEILHARSSYFRERLMWIDGLCIDQTKGASEKPSQLRLMGEIYRLSSRTIVWLGYSTNSLGVVDILHQIELARRWYGLGGRQMNNRFSKRTEARGMQALIDLLSHPWFTRMWVIQEVAVPQTVHVMYGGKYLSWEQIIYAIETLNQPETVGLLTLKRHDAFRKLALSDGSADAATNAFISCLSTMPQGFQLGWLMHNLRRRVQPESLSLNGPFSSQPLRNLPLHELLLLCCWFEATEAKDKIFALLGITARPLPPGLVEMYNAKTHEIYKFVAQAIPSKEYLNWTLPLAGIGLFDPDDGEEGLLDEGEKGRLDEGEKGRLDEGEERLPDPRRKRLRGIPSWVPDWGSPPLAYPLTGLASAIQPYAAGTVPNPPIPNIVGDTMHLKGVKVTRIKKVANHCFRAERIDFQALAEQFEEIISMCSDAQLATRYHHPENSSEGTDSAIREAIWRTLVGNKTTEGHQPAPSTWSQHYDTVLALLEAFRVVDGCASTNSGRFVAHDIDSKLAKIRLGSSSTDFSVRVGYLIKGRKFAVMQDNSIGWVPAACKAEDSVFIPLGAQVPSALRNIESNAYQLLGECYVHGIMRGEVFRVGCAVEDIILV